MSEDNIPLVEIAHQENQSLSYSDVENLNIIDVIDKTIAKTFEQHPQMKGLRSSLGKHYRLRLVIDIYERLKGKDQLHTKKFGELSNQDFLEISKSILEAVKKRVHIAKKANHLNLALNTLNVVAITVFNTLAYYGINVLNCDHDTEDDFLKSFKQQSMIPSIFAALTIVMTTSTLMQQDGGNHCSEVILHSASALAKKVFAKSQELSKKKREELLKEIIRSDREAEKHLNQLDETLLELAKSEGIAETAYKYESNKQEFHESLRYYMRFVTAITFALGGVALSDKIYSAIIQQSLSKEAICNTETGYIQDDLVEFVTNFMPKAIVFITSAVRNHSNTKREEAFYGIDDQIQKMCEISLSTLSAIEEKNIGEMIFQLSQSVDLQHDGQCSHRNHQHSWYDYAKEKTRQLYGGVMWLSETLNPLAAKLTGDDYYATKYDKIREEIERIYKNERRVSQAAFAETSADEQVVTNGRRNPSQKPSRAQCNRMTFVQESEV